jgi:hypothetical protein
MAKICKFVRMGKKPHKRHVTTNVIRIWEILTAMNARTAIHDAAAPPHCRYVKTENIKIKRHAPTSVTNYQEKRLTAVNARTAIKNATTHRHLSFAKTENIKIKRHVPADYSARMERANRHQRAEMAKSILVNNAMVL